jgi:hypothetical protein
MNVTKIIIHQNWEMIDNFNDIALMRTERPIKYSINDKTNQYIVNTICLPDSTDMPPNRAQVAGWGRVNPTAYTVDLLQKATVPRFSWEVCKENFKAIGPVTQHMMCFGGMGRPDSCIVSFRFNCFLELILNFN